MLKTMEDMMAMKSQKRKDVANAQKFAMSQRGQLIIAQALAIASKSLKEKEPSNASDMIFLGEHLFQPFWTIYADEEFAKMQQKIMDQCNEHNKKLLKKESK